MTLLVRDEEDIVDEQLRYHLEHGVDFVVATDHRSVDGTTDILRRYEREGRLHYIAEQREEYLQAEYVGRMARLAATDFRADWVINADADEFWWPREGSFAELFAAVPSRFGVVLGCWRHFVMRPDDDRAFFERMIWRRRPSSDASDPYHPSVKVAHRSHPQVELMQGNHKVLTESLVALPEWLPIEVLHFPLRSRAQLAGKVSKVSVEQLVRQPPVWMRVAGELESSGPERVAERFVVDDDRLAAGLGSGALTRDTRVRDALRRTESAPPSVADDAALARELDDLPVASCSRLAPRVDALRRRIAAIDGGADA